MEIKGKHIDVAVIGGGPAGLQAALVLARTRKDVVVFDAPTPPRNDASHGVHNFVGLDGLLPQEIRDRAWQQIDVYESARLVRDAVQSVTRSDESGLVDTLGLQLDEYGYVAVDESQKTNVERLWAAGDVQGWMGGIESANAGGMAASMIVAEWFAGASQ